MKTEGDVREFGSVTTRVGRMAVSVFLCVLPATPQSGVFHYAWKSAHPADSHFLHSSGYDCLILKINPGKRTADLQTVRLVCS